MTVLFSPFSSAPGSFLVPFSVPFSVPFGTFDGTLWEPVPFAVPFCSEGFVGAFRYLN